MIKCHTDGTRSRYYTDTDISILNSRYRSNTDISEMSVLYTTNKLLKGKLPDCIILNVDEVKYKTEISVKHIKICIVF